MEDWKDVQGYEGLYKVSNLGEVISLARKRKNGKPYKSRLLKPTLRNGYMVVGLTRDGVTKGYKVHRLVAQAFIPNVDNKPCVDHIDTNRANNSVENLRWVTYKENNNNPLSYKIWSKAVSDSRRTMVAQYDKEGVLLNIYPSIINASKAVIVSAGCICDCCKGRLKSAGGFIWKYFKEEQK